MNDKLADCWESLAASLDDKIGLRRIRVEPLKHRVYAGWFMPANKPALALVVNNDNVPADINLPRCAGFLFSIAPTPFNQRESLVLLQLDSEDYSAVFDKLAEDIREEIGSIDCESSLIDVIVARLRHWQLFLRNRDSTRLSHSDQIGLWGEIWFLRTHLIPRLGVEKSVQAWRGPERANQDFEFRGQAVEVKTSSLNPEARVHISNILQLVDEGLDILFLRYISVSTHQGAGTSLADLVSRARNDLEAHTAARQQFDLKLFCAGYLDSEESHYRRIGLSVLSETTYHIRSGFPRLLPEDLPPGVGQVKYAISLGACNDYMVIPDPFEQGSTHA